MSFQQKRRIIKLLLFILHLECIYLVIYFFDYISGYCVFANTATSEYSIHSLLDVFFKIFSSTLSIYRIRVYKMPLLIKLPLLENSIEIQINRHFFAQKSSFWGFFQQKLEKFHSYFNKPPPQTLDFL